MRKLVLIILGGVLLAMPAMAQVDPWNAAFNQIPANTDLVSAGDDAIRDLKGAINERMVIQHHWRPGAGESYMGFHKEGSAWLLDSPNCSAAGIDADQQIGQLCREQDDSSLWMAEAGGGTWIKVTPSQTNANGETGAGFDGYVPENAIILWDAVGGDGDEDCNGVTTAGDCPCGYHEADEFRNLTIRGADAAGAEPDIPDVEGNSCTGGGAPPCSVVANMYDDTLSILQMPAHTHDMNITLGGPPNTGGMIATDPLGAAVTSSSTGGGDDHYHPFRTVLFCRKN